MNSGIGEHKSGCKFASPLPPRQLSVAPPWRESVTHNTKRTTLICTDTAVVAQGNEH